MAVVRVLVAAVALGWLLQPASAQPRMLPSPPGIAADEGSVAANKLGLKVRTFAQENLGKKVDNGECAMLAVLALEAAGAKTTSDYGVLGAGADYKWGTLVGNYEDVQPGDIIQYRDVKLVTKTLTKLPGGGTRTSTRTRTYVHHTAIVSWNQGKGKFKVLEQNVGSKGKDEAARKVVREDEIDLKDKTEGTVWIYRPVKK